MSKNALTLAGLLLIASLLGGTEMAGGSADFSPLGFLSALASMLEGDRVHPFLATDLGALFGHDLADRYIAD